MSDFSATFFLGKMTHVRGSASVHPVLYVEPDGWHHGGSLNLQIDSKLSDSEKLAIADQFAKAVSAWRDEIAADTVQQKTAADELADALAEIERLKSEAGEVNV